MVFKNVGNSGVNAHITNQPKGKQTEKNTSPQQTDSNQGLSETKSTPEMRQQILMEKTKANQEKARFDNLTHPEKNHEKILSSLENKGASQISENSQEFQPPKVLDVKTPFLKSVGEAHLKKEEKMLVKEAKESGQNKIVTEGGVHSQTIQKGVVTYFLSEEEQNKNKIAFKTHGGTTKANYRDETLNTHGNKTPISATDSKPNRMIYAMDKNKEFYAKDQYEVDSETIRHSSLLGGDQTGSAGEIQVDFGAKAFKQELQSLKEAKGIALLKDKTFLKTLISKLSPEEVKGFFVTIGLPDLDHHGFKENNNNTEDNLQKILSQFEINSDYEKQGYNVLIKKDSKDVYTPGQTFLIETIDKAFEKLVQRQEEIEKKLQETEGEVTHITDRSGHYQPSAHHVGQAINALEEKHHVDISKVSVEFTGNKDFLKGHDTYKQELLVSAFALQSATQLKKGMTFEAVIEKLPQVVEVADTNPQKYRVVNSGESNLEPGVLVSSKDYQNACEQVALKYVDVANSALKKSEQVKQRLLESNRAKSLLNQPENMAEALNNPKNMALLLEDSEIVQGLLKDPQIVQAILKEPEMVLRNTLALKSKVHQDIISPIDKVIIEADQFGLTKGQILSPQEFEEKRKEIMPDGVPSFKGIATEGQFEKGKRVGYIEITHPGESGFRKGEMVTLKAFNQVKQALKIKATVHRKMPESDVSNQIPDVVKKPINPFAIETDGFDFLKLVSTGYGGVSDPDIPVKITDPKNSHFKLGSTMTIKALADYNQSQEPANRVKGVREHNTFLDPPLDSDDED